MIFFQMYHERQQQHNAARMEQAVRREFWFSSAMDKLRQPRGRANEENEITSSQLPNPSAPKPVTPPPPLPSKPKPIPAPIPLQD